MAFASAPRRRKLKHVIADCHYEPLNGPSWTLCSCGHRIDAADPGALAKEYGRHTGRTMPS